MKLKNTWAQVAVCCLGGMVGFSSLFAAPRPPGSMLPSDTLAVLTIPHFPDAKTAFLGDPYVRLFDDPSMKAYTDKITTTFEQNVMGGLEKQLGIKLSEYTELMNGQLTVAFFVNAPEGAKQPSFDLMLALDSGDKSDQLREKLADVRKRFADAGQTLRPITIRNQSFYRIKPNGKGNDNDSKGTPNELYMGQVDSFLMISSSAAVMQKVLASGSDGAVTSLADNPSFKKIFANRLKGSCGYGWVNFAEVYKLIVPQVKAMDRQFGGNANPLIPKPSAVLDALGLGGLEGLSFNLKELPKGSMVEFTMSVPEKGRRGLFELLALEKKDSLPMNRIPEDVVSFSRTRVNLAAFWSELEGMVGELAPPVMGFVELFLGGLGKDRDPNFDFRESFFGNLGDDLITIGLPPRSSKLEDVANPPSLTLLGSPDPKRLAEALVVATGLIPSGGNVLSEREFLGRTIYSFTIPGLALPGAAQPGQDPAAGAGFYMAPDDGYLVFSMDEQTVEDYLRGPSSSQKPLRRIAGLNQAIRFLGEDQLTSFRYDNAAELVKKLWELGRENPELLTGGLGAAALAVPQPFSGLDELADFSSLPPFDRVAKYFHYSVGGSSSDAEHLNYRWFRPTPPNLK
jgi:hypothetical protein